MKSPEQAKADFEAQRDAILVRIGLVWWGLTVYFWQVVPHRHTYETHLFCTRCSRSVQELIRRGRRL